jgi:hypothetical protein
MHRRTVLFLVTAVIAGALAGCGSVPGFKPEHVGTWEYRKGERRTVLQLNSDGTGVLYTKRSNKAIPNAKDLLWSNVDGVINLHSSLGTNQRAAVPFQSVRVINGELAWLNVETKEPTGRSLRRVSGLTGMEMRTGD